MYVDTHCHLDFAVFDASRTQLYQDSIQAGISDFVIPSVSPQSWQTTLDVAASFKHMHCALGCHPWYIQQMNASAFDRLKALVKVHSPIAIGEIGLDFHPNQPYAIDKQLQIYWFEQQLSLAQMHSLPVIVHCRQAYGALLASLAKFNLSGVIHAFSGSIEVASQLINRNFYLGVGGLVANLQAHKVQSMLKALPISSIVLETDAPDMAPPWMAGQPNSPINIPRYAQLLADLKGISIDVLRPQILLNTQQLFKIAR